MGRVKNFLRKVWGVIQMLGPPAGDEQPFTSKEFRRKQKYKKLQEENLELRKLLEAAEDIIEECREERDPAQTNEDGTQKNSFKDGY